MSNTYPAGTVFNVCQCCTWISISGGDDTTGCRDHYGHTHNDGFIPTECVYTGDSGQEYLAEWICDACGEWQPVGTQLHYWTATEDTSGPYSAEWGGQ